jgi:hypothetical protein
MKSAFSVSFLGADSSVLLDFGPRSVAYQRSTVMFVPSPDARFDARTDTYGRSERREERAMGIKDLEAQRERRVEMLREAESRRVAGSRRSGRGARASSGLAGFLAIVR